MTSVTREDYFSWLSELTDILHTRNPHRSYWNLLQQLNEKPFRWFVQKDHNRGEDAKELRTLFLDELGVRGRPNWLDSDVSMLEILIVLSRMLEFEAYGSGASASAWFWKLLENLDFRHYTDANYNDEVASDVDEALEILLSRTYSPDGRGGLFPLRRANADQRTIELWYQMSAYIIEGGEVDNGP